MWLGDALGNVVNSIARVFVVKRRSDVSIPRQEINHMRRGMTNAAISDLALL